MILGLHFIDNRTCVCVEGLDRAVGGRCFLEVFVLRHPVGHNVFMETICKQPKARNILELLIFLLLAVYSL